MTKPIFSVVLLLALSSCDTEPKDDNIGGKYSHHHKEDPAIQVLVKEVADLKAEIAAIKSQTPPDAGGTK